MTKIEFVNHASYIVSSNNVSLIVDPWIEGTAFNDGWNLIEPTPFSYNDFKKITHIWFSHEHPDHFSPNNLKKIPKEIRSNITVLFHKTRDRKIIDFCNQNDFKECIELDNDWYQLGLKFRILNLPHTDGDSWMCLDVNDKIIINLNDCVFESELQIKHVKTLLRNKDIDILFTQFSYANWVGNIDDKESHKKFASNKINDLSKQLSILNPKYVIPFASYVWFCHEENYFMNESVNRIDFVFKYIADNFKSLPVVLFPGDNWDIDSQFNSEQAVKKWMNSISLNVKEENTIKGQSIEEKELLSSANSFILHLIKNNSFLIRCFLKPSYIFITDYNMAYKLSLKGFKKSPETHLSFCDISLTSGALQYCFKFLWGGSTVRINGRYQVPENGNFYIWKLYFQISELNNHGKKFNFGYILNVLFRKISRVIFRK